MKNLFVPFIISKRLRDKGFDIPCITYYGFSGILQENYNEPMVTNSDLEQAAPVGTVSAPLWQQAIDWLREEKKIHIVIYYSELYNVYEYSMLSIPDGEIKGFKTGFKTYYSALQSVVEKALD